jgi:hypothetical protein
VSTGENQEDIFLEETGIHDLLTELQENQKDTYQEGH